MIDIKEETISKKLAANEVYKKLKKIHIICMCGIGTTMVCAIFSTFNGKIGAAVAGIISLGYGFFLIKNKTDMNYLEVTYLGKPTQPKRGS